MRHIQDLHELERKASLYTAAFDAINGMDKITLREREIEELERRLGQIEIMIQKIEEESTVEIEKGQKDSNKTKIINEMLGLLKELIELKIEMEQRIGKNLNEARNQVQTIKA